MTWKEYENRKKFTNEEHIYPKTATFGIGSIFETHHLRTGALTYVKVIFATDDLWLFNVSRCDSKGNFLSTKKIGTSRTEMMQFVIDNEWRLYKQHFGKRELIPKVKGYLAPKKDEKYTQRN